MIGELLAGRYELQDVAGSGGMSSVYRARDTVLERTVAIKILHEHYSDDPEYVERFRREARALAQLNHPNIVTVIDRGEFEGRQFIVFEHVEGENLKELVDREGQLPVDEALALVHQVARGLAFAHEHGVVHRDVKPHNVLIDTDGVAKVTDFGIARSLEPADGLTETGTLLGTSEYIAPEQASGRRVDERSDQYSLATVLYELLTGAPPFTGDNFMAVAMKHVQEPVPSVREARPDVSPRLDAIVSRAMAKRPEDRFPTTEAMMAALEAARADTDGVLVPAPVTTPDDGVTESIPVPGPLPPSIQRSRKRFPLPILIGLILVGVAALVIALVIAGGGTDSLTGNGGGGGGSGDRVRLVALSDFDPSGDDTEHPEAVRAATDGSATTYWTTESYSSFDKSGVGIVLDAKSGANLTELTVTTDTPGYTAVIEASNRSDGGFKVVSASQTVEEQTTFDLEGGDYRYYLIWITSLDGHAHVNEVRART
jgi:eukaryotic-like serine/threonine-protein kinase